MVITTLPDTPAHHSWHAWYGVVEPRPAQVLLVVEEVEGKAGGQTLVVGFGVHGPVTATWDLRFQLEMFNKFVVI